MLKNISFLLIFYYCQNFSVAQNANNIYLFQNGIEYTISPKTRKIQIDKNEFAFRFYNKKYEEDEHNAIRLTAFLRKKEWNKLKVGMKTSETSCFEGGTGLAGYQNRQYPELLFEKNAHHYLYYENEDDKRLKLLESSEDLLKLEFTVSSLDYNNSIIKVSESELSHFYVAVWMDRNLNRKLDSGELYKFIIEFIVL